MWHVKGKGTHISYCRLLGVSSFERDFPTSARDFSISARDTSLF